MNYTERNEINMFTLSIALPFFLNNSGFCVLFVSLEEENTVFY